MRMQITLEEAVAGTDKEIEVLHSEACAACAGSGSETKKTNVCPALRRKRADAPDRSSPCSASLSA